jgi:hypothetical protein
MIARTIFIFIAFTAFETMAQTEKWRPEGWQPIQQPIKMDRERVEWYVSTYGGRPEPGFNTPHFVYYFFPDMEVVIYSTLLGVGHLWENGPHFRIMYKPLDPYDLDIQQRMGQFLAGGQIDWPYLLAPLEKALGRKVDVNDSSPTYLRGLSASLQKAKNRIRTKAGDAYYLFMCEKLRQAKPGRHWTLKMILGPCYFYDPVVTEQDGQETRYSRQVGYYLRKHAIPLDLEEFLKSSLQP